MMKSLLTLSAAAFLLSAASGQAGEPVTKGPQHSPTTATPVYRENAFDLETGVLWQVGHFTNIDYRLVPTQLSWRSKRMFGWDFSDGSSVSVRNRATMIGTWVENGPESRYLGFSFSPSVEYWNAAQTWSVYAGSGGGFGWIDSQGVPGGQGQDFTLNWFGQLGVQHVISPAMMVRAGAMFQHMSNGGATDPNPGIDAVGFTLGVTWRF